MLRWYYQLLLFVWILHIWHWALWPWFIWFFLHFDQGITYPVRILEPVTFRQVFTLVITLFQITLFFRLISFLQDNLLKLLLGHWWSSLSCCTMCLNWNRCPISVIIIFIHIVVTFTVTVTYHLGLSQLIELLVLHVQG